MSNIQYTYKNLSRQSVSPNYNQKSVNLNNRNISIKTSNLCTMCIILIPREWYVRDNANDAKL